MRRFLCHPLPEPDQVAWLSPEESHHLTHVLRRRVGATIELFDGRGRTTTATVGDERADRVQVIGLTPVQYAEPPREVHLLLAILRGPAMDLALRMATETGVTEIHPVLVRRCTAQGDRNPRWVRIVQAATKQCRRPRLPVVHPACDLSAALHAVKDVPDRRLMAPDAPQIARPLQDVALLIGPEGGFTDAETRQSQAAGFLLVGLGPHILRADTATAVAIAMNLPAVATAGDRS